MKQYTLKVYPEGQARKAYRIIEISGNDTLDRLCEVILSAFDFIHEHLYEFSMSGRLYSDDNYTCDPEYKGQPSTDIKLDKLSLEKGQKFVLHYDFGDDWVFEILVQDIHEEKVRAIAHMVDGKGDVEQYPDYEDWDEDDDDFDEEPEESIEARKENKKYMDLFFNDLQAAGLSEKTIRNHMENVDFYLTDYVPFEDDEAKGMKGGAETYMLRGFLGYFYIHKCMWSTPNNLKTTGASLKKFYKCMADHGEIDKVKYKDICTLFKEEMADWQEECRKFNDDDDDFFVW